MQMKLARPALLHHNTWQSRTCNTHTHTHTHTDTTPAGYRDSSLSRHDTYGQDHENIYNCTTSQLCKTHWSDDAGAINSDDQQLLRVMSDRRLSVAHGASPAITDIAHRHSVEQSMNTTK